MGQQIELMRTGNETFDEIEVTSRLLNIILELPLEQQLNLLNQLDASGYGGSRRHARNCLKNPWVVLIHCKKEKDSWDNFIRDISRCGMFIETKGTFCIGEKIKMTFQVPANKKQFKIVGEIVRVQKNGIGVKFKRQVSIN